MEVRLENTVEYIKTRVPGAQLIGGNDLALIGFTLDGRALYDGRLLEGTHSEKEGRAILRASFEVNDEDELVSTVAQLGFSEVSLLRPGYADVSAACVGITVSGRLVFSSHRMIDVIGGAGYDGDAGFSELADILASSDDPLCPVFARFAPAVREIYGEKPLAGDRPLYTDGSCLPGVLHVKSSPGHPCLVGATLTKCPVYDAQGYIPRLALQEKVSAARCAERSRSNGVFLILPAPPDYVMELRLGERTWSLRSFARTLGGRPVFDGTRVLEEVGSDVFRLVTHLGESPDNPVLVFGPER